MKHDFFSVIDSEAKAYLYGYLCADGYNNEGRHCIQISQTESDMETLELFQTQLEHTGKLTRSVYGADGCNRRPSRMLSINSKQMSRDLAEKGCVQRKSLILEMPNLDAELLHHFVRGYFDGDGCIYLKERKDGALVIECPIVCSHIFAEQLNQILLEKLQIKTYSQRLGKNKVCTTIKISGRKNNLIFLQWLYRDSHFALSRKKALFEKFLALCNERIYYKHRAPRITSRFLPEG